MTPDVHRSGGDTSSAESAGAAGRWPAVLVYGAVPVLIAGLMAYYLHFSKSAAGELGLPLDDSWIHVRFAQNLARGRGFSFNPGEPTSTTTGALWTLLLALGYRATGEYLFTGIALNCALCVLLCVVVYYLAVALGLGAWAAAGTAVLAAATAPLPWWALSGMEPPLYGVLSLFGVLLHTRLRAGRGAVALAPAAVFALAGLARPECFLLFPLALADRLVMAWRAEGGRSAAMKWARELPAQAVVFAVIAAPLFAYNYRTTGYLLPTSFYSKLQWMSLPAALQTHRVPLFSALVIGPLRELGELFLVWAGDNVVLILPFFVGCWWVAARARSGDRSLLIPAVIIVQPIAWALVAGYRPPGFQSQRYLAALNPLFLLLGIAGGCWVMERARSLRRPWVRVVLFGLAFAASLARQPAAARTYALNVKDTNEMQVAIGRWVRDNAPAGSLLAVNDVGAIGVISNCPVLDLQGLVTPEVLALRDPAHRAAGTAPQALFEFIAARKPDYLIIFPQWYPELDARRDLFTPVFGVLLKDNITCGAPLMVVYRTRWANDTEPEEGSGR